MAYYIVAHADVRDIETYRRYAERAEELMVQHGARVLVGGVRGRYVEGNGPKRHSIVVFPRRGQCRCLLHVRCVSGDTATCDAVRDAQCRGGERAGCA